MVGPSHFRSHYEHTMDGKGRVSIPARYREILAEIDPNFKEKPMVILTRTFFGCLALYPMNVWTEFEDKVSKLHPFKREARTLRHVYINHAEELQLDNHGRICVKQNLRDSVGLEGKVVWAGQIDHVELWSEAKWNEVIADNLEDMDAVADALASLDTDGIFGKF